MMHKKYHVIRLATMICSSVIIAGLLVFGIVVFILILLFGRMFCGFFVRLASFRM